MFVIPNEAVTEVKADEIFYVCRMGEGRARLCGNKICLDVPGKDLRLGMKFIATRTNRLVPKEPVNQPPKSNTITVQFTGLMEFNSKAAKEAATATLKRLKTYSPNIPVT